MPITIDHTQVLEELERLINQAIPRQVEAGMREGAELMQAAMQETTAHGDQTGATRASYRAAIDADWPAAASSGYAAAQAAIAAADAAGRGHGGQALLEDSGVTQEEGHRLILLSAMTDYIDRLVIDNAGEKDAITPALQGYASLTTQLIAQEPLT